MFGLEQDEAPRRHTPERTETRGHGGVIGCLSFRILLIVLR